MTTLTMNPARRVEPRTPAAARPLPKGVARPADLEADLRRARTLADWLDTKFQVAGVRFGVEGIIGLVPFVGDFAGALIGLYPIFLARRHRLGKTVQTRMAANLLIEWGLGLVPVVGDLFDVAYKANVRNVRLFEQAALKAGRASPRG